MKLSLFSSLFLLIRTVSADRTILVLLNNGVADSTAGSCNDADYTKLQGVVMASSLNSTYTRRNLRAPIEDLHDMTKSLMSQPMEHRSLPQNYCKNDCEPFPDRHCLVVGCKGYRRRNLMVEPDKRDLLSGASFTCTQQVNYVHSTFDKLVNQSQISASCKTLLSKPRAITCYDDVIYGVVEYFKLWDTNASPQKVINSNYTGQNIPKALEVNFEAVTNNCVDHLLTTITGPNGYTMSSGEYIRPFTVFGDTVTINGQINGVKLPYLGTYTLTALPDGLIEKKKVMTFTVVPGTVTAVKLWDTVSKTVMNSNFTGGSICNSKEFTFEAVTTLTDTCKMTLTSTNGFSTSNTETMTPFSIFTDVAGVFNGRKLSNGSYTLTIYPDEVATNMKTISFNIVTC